MQGCTPEVSPKFQARNSSTKSIGVARREKLREERLVTFVPGVNSGLVSIEPLLRSPQKREQK